MSKLPTSRLPVTPSKVATTQKSGLRPPQNTSTNAPVSQQTSPSSADTTTASFLVGDRVTANGKNGTVAFVGGTKFADGEWIGIILDDAQGKNDGSYEGTRYFETEANRGLFCRPAKVQRLAQAPNSVKQVDNVATADVEKTQTDNDKQKSVAQAAAPSQELRVGDRVLVSGSKPGTLRYIGKIHVAEGVWCGIQLDEPQGKNDGSVSGKRYFSCQQRFGLFSPIARVEKANNDTAQQQVTTRKESVSSSTANNRPLHRSNSQESLHSNISELSTSSNSISRIPTRTPAKVTQQKMPTHQYTTPNTKSLLTQAAATLAATQPSSAQVANLIQTLKEKDIYIEKLQQQREQDRLEFSRAAQQVDEMESRMLAFKQQLTTKESENEQLIKDQYETKQRLEDLEFQLEEYKLNETNKDQTSATTIPEGHRLLTPKDIAIYEDIKGKLLELESANQKLALEKQTVQDEHRQELKRQSETHEQEQEKQKKELTIVKATSDDYEKQIQQLKEQLAELLNNGENQSKLLAQQVDEYRSKADQANKDVEQMRSELKQSSDRLTQLEELLNNGQHQSTNLSQQLEQSKKELDEIRAELQQTRNENDKNEKLSNERLLQLKNYEETVVPQLKSQLSEIMSSGENQTEAITKQLQEYRTQVENAQKETDSIRSDLKRVQEDKDTNEKSLTERIAQLEQSLNQGQDETKTYRQQIEESTKAMDEIRSQLKRVQEENESTEKLSNERLSQLKNYEENLVPQLKSQLAEILDSGENQTTVLGQQLQEFQSKLEQANKENDEIRSRLNLVQDEKKSVEEKIKNYEEIIIPELRANGENQTATLQQKIQEYQCKLEEINKDFEKTQIQLKSIAEENDENQKKSNEYLTKLKNYEDNVVPQLEQQFQTLKLNIEERDRTSTTALNECQSQYEQKVKELMDQNEQNIKQIEQLKQDLKDRENQQNTLLNEREQQYKQENERLENELKQLQEREQTQSQVSTTLQQVETKNLEMLEQNESLRKELESVQTKYQQLQKTYQEYSTSNDNDLNEKQALIDQLNQQIQTVQDETKKKQTQLEETIKEYQTKLETMKKELIEVNNSVKENVEKQQSESSNNQQQSTVTDETKQNQQEMEGQIQFLNDVIIDLRNANEDLKKEIEFLKNPYLHDPDLFETNEVVMRTKSAAPRLYCDMCEVFDEHDTDDCPKQSSMADDQPLSTGETRERVIPPPRAYCDKCEEFGHDCNEVDETY